MINSAMHDFFLFSFTEKDFKYYLSSVTKERNTFKNIPNFYILLFMTKLGQYNLCF